VTRRTATPASIMRRRRIRPRTLARALARTGMAPAVAVTAARLLTGRRVAGATR